MAPPLPRLQDLPPKWARFCLGVEAFAAEELGCDFTRASCVAACSGGADSTALLLLSALLCRKNGGSLSAVHLDHALRPESQAEAEFVAGLCEKWNIPLVRERQDIAALAREGRIGLEEAGRNARYALLERVRRASGAQYVLVAHQLNDLAEDQLLRLMRGGGWPALGGMAGVDAARGLLRPLLLTSRAELEGFLRACGQTWQVDASNLAPCSTRNRVRLNILPALEAENPAYLDAAARLWRQARCDEGHWDAALAPLLAALPAPAPGEALLLPAAMLDAAAPALRLRLFKAALERLGPGQPLADALFRLDELWRQRATGKRLRFPGDKEARLAKSGVLMQAIDRKKECG
jgi:tRNA(Ile)-lysidine synthase